MSVKKPPKLLKPLEELLEVLVNEERGGEPSAKPSDFGKMCPRLVFYSYLRVQKDRKGTAKNKRILDVGNVYHDLIKDWLIELSKTHKDIFIQFVDPETKQPPINKYSGKPDYEFPVEFPEFGVKRGKIDGVGIIDDAVWVYEFKTIKEDAFRKLRAPLPEHINQAMSYVFMLERGLGQGAYAHIEPLSGRKDVAGVIFLYCDKNTQDIKEFVVYKDATAKQNFIEILQKLERNLEYVSFRELPPRCKTCDKYCDYQIKCDNNFNPLEQVDQESTEQ